MKKKVEKLKEGEKAAGISGIVSLLLASLKAIVGFLSGSLILISDSLHSFADSIVIFAAWFGLKFSQKKPTEKFPYGYYKSENLITLFISLFILFGSLDLLKEGYESLFSIPTLTLPLPALLVALISIITSYFLANYLSKVGRKINAQSLIVKSKETMIDIFSSSMVFIGILLSFYKVPYIEGIFTIAISLAVLKIGISSIKDSIFSLMDVAPSEELTKKIKKIISSIKGVEGYRNLKLRKSGPFVFGEVNIRVQKNINVKKAHEIADELEKKIIDEVEEVDSFNIHIEPHEKKEVKIAIPISQDNGLDSQLMEHFGRTSYFLFVLVDKEKKKVKTFYTKSNPFRLKRAKVGLSVANFLLKEKIDLILTKEIGEISFHTLRDNLIEIFMAKGNTAKEAINNFLEGRAEAIEKPTKKEEETIESRLETFRGRRRRRGPWWR